MRACVLTPVMAVLLAGCRGEPRPRLQAIAPGTPFSFAVVGDNRGESSGAAAPAFVRIIQRISLDTPALLLNTGDMINGYAGEDEAHLRQLWDGYKRAITPLKIPVYHAPGNHDLFDAVSARIWKDLWGPTYYTFDYSDARFIALDTESEAGRVGDSQFEWLRKQLADSAGRRVFLFMHRPLFPIDGHIGSSLDAHPADRDRLHQLFVRNRDRIKGVFLGHEHLYYHETRDGVPYYTVAGGGAPLYVPRELGGFYHYLAVNVAAEKVSVTVNRIDEAAGSPPPAQSVSPGTLLESWENPLFWYVWDQSVGRELTRERAREGSQGIRVTFDLSKYPYPSLYAPLYPSRDLSRVGSMQVDVFAPEGVSDTVSVTPILFHGKDEHGAPPVALKPGWNTVTADLRGAWLPPAARRSVGQIQWTVSSPNPALASWVLFDHLRAGSEAWESWEAPLLWGAWNEDVHQSAAPDLKTAGRRGLRLELDFSQCPLPRLYAPLQPARNMSRVRRLQADVYASPKLAPVLTARLVLQSGDERYVAPANPLKAGWNRVTADLDGAWLPAPARGRVEQVEWTFQSKDRKVAGWIVLDDFKATP